MALATTATVAAGGIAAAAYLNAKLHLRKDLETLWAIKHVEREYARNEKADRLSPFYFFEEAVSSHPDIEAIWSREGIYTWKETHNRACQYAAYFLEQNVRPSQIVALCMQNSPEFIFAWLGLWAIRCAPAMINFNLTGDALIHCLNVSGAKLIIVDEDLKVLDRVAGEKQRIEKVGMVSVVLNKELKNTIAAKPVQRPDDSYRAGLKGKYPSAIFYTSGTTGFPKGASMTTTRMHMSGCRRGYGFGQRSGPGGDRWYICMPMYHGTGGIMGMGCIMAGTSIAIGKGFSVRRFWQDIHDSESTLFLYVGETARYLLAAPPGPLDKNHKVKCMYGNGLRPDVWKPFQARFNIPEVAEFFNSSEGLLGLFVWNCGDYNAECVGHHGALLRYLMHDIYVPVQIDHETDEIVKDPKTGFAKRNSYAEGGEILVKLSSKDAFAGYWNNPSATEKKYITDVFRKGDLYYRSGDALRRTDDGRWSFLDRLGDTYRWKSENVSTTEVAEVLGRYHGIHEANVYGVKVPGHEGRAGCAALTIAPEVKARFDWRGFAREARGQLPRYAVPVFVRVMEGEVGDGASHNNKQDKIRLRTEGVEPGVRGTKVPGGERDRVFWLPLGGEEYMPFGDKEWEGLINGRAKL